MFSTPKKSASIAALLALALSLISLVADHAALRVALLRTKQHAIALDFRTREWHPALGDDAAIEIAGNSTPRADTPGGDAHLPVTQPEVELSVCARVTWGLWRRAPQAAEIVNGNYRIVPGSKRRCRGGGESPRGDDA